jgi:tetratricopeptide (TPR) repeat protein
MNLVSQFLLLMNCCGVALQATAQQSKPTPTPAAVKRSAATTTKPVRASNPASEVPAATGNAVQGKPAQAEPKTEIGAEQLITQGKALLKTNKHPQALAKFEAALKLEPERDDALGLAADLAYRLDDQVKARTWFLRRAELSNQKDSIRAYCFYRTALSYWRNAHDEIAMYGTYQAGQTVFKLTEKSLAVAEEQITSGLYYADRALSLTNQYAEAHNLKNLLHSEWARIGSDETVMAEQQRLALTELRRALALSKDKDPKTLTADFGTPTMLVGEFAPTKADEEDSTEPATPLLAGGNVLTRVDAIFPSARAIRRPDPGDDSASGVTKDGGAYSLGSGRGALTAAYTPGKVKVEILISITGEVVFAHIVQGRSDLNGAAVVAARKWKFKPATFEGEPVQLSGVITFDMKPGRSRPAAKPTKP